MIQALGITAGIILICLGLAYVGYRLFVDFMCTKGK